jgi:hypothetical protein
MALACTEGQGQWQESKGNLLAGVGFGKGGGQVIYQGEEANEAQDHSSELHDCDPIKSLARNQEVRVD